MAIDLPPSFVSLAPSRCSLQVQAPPRRKSVARLTGWSMIITRLAWRQLTTSSLNRQQMHYTLYREINQGVFQIFFRKFSRIFAFAPRKTRCFRDFAHFVFIHGIRRVHIFSLPALPRTANFLFAHLIFANP
jgi:hypothetical protein